MTITQIIYYAIKDYKYNCRFFPRDKALDMVLDNAIIRYEYNFVPNMKDKASLIECICRKIRALESTKD